MTKTSMAVALDYITSLLDAIEAIRELHRPGPWGQACHHCQAVVPCPTQRILDHYKL